MTTRIPLSFPKSTATLGRMREQWLAIVFEGDGLPTAGAESYTVSADPITLPANCASIDVAVTRASQGNPSESWVFVPSSPVSPTKFIHYIAGHAQHFYDNSGNGGKDCVDHFLAKGFYVVGSCMPMCGTNPENFTSAYSGDNIPWGSSIHALIVQDAFNHKRCTTRAFVEPMVKLDNELIARFSPGHLYLMGMSGGGYMAHLLAAADVRIERSYPVSGGVPYDVGMGPATEYDWEQNPDIVIGGRNANPALVIATGLQSWRGIYAMGAYPSRRQMQSLGSADPCCFEWLSPVDRQVEYRDYERDVQLMLGGRGDFSINFTVTDLHSAVPSLAAIDADLGV